MKTAAKIRLAELKKAKKQGSKGKGSDVEAAKSPDEAIVPKDQRPQHRLGWIPFVGEKVDTIEWARKEILACNELLDRGRSIINQDQRAVKKGPKEEGGEREHDKLENDRSAAAAPGEENQPKQDGHDKEDINSSYPPMNSAFITFNKQIAAHLALKSLTHHEPYRMSKCDVRVKRLADTYYCTLATKFVEVAPQDVIWGNLNLNPYEQRVGFTCLLRGFFLWVI